jgi:hypothetical protein
LSGINLVLAGCQPPPIEPLQLATPAGAVTFGEVDPRAAEVQARIDTGDYQGAIDKAIELYEIDVGAVAGRPLYLPADAYCRHGSEGATYSTGQVVICPGAFVSPGVLAITIGHEAVHARRVAAGTWPTTDQARNMAEVEAYRWQFNQAEAYGLTPEERDICRRRLDAYYAELTAANKALVNQKIYVPAFSTGAGDE